MKRLEINEEITWCENLLERGKSSYKMSYLYAIIQYPRTGKETLNACRFLIDTGASISILNREFSDFIEDNFREIDYLTVQYGGSNKRLPVYEFNLKIKGYCFNNVRMAYDNTMVLPSLLGQFDFLNTLDYLHIDYKKKKQTKLIWNYDR